MTLIIKDLHVSREGKELLRGVTISIEPGTTTALMGPNGSGKTTLANTIMGHPAYRVTKGSITYNGEDLAKLPPEERAKKGIFLSFQQPTTIPGLNVEDYLRTIVQERTGERQPLIRFRKRLQEQMAELGIDRSFTQRYLNQGFSGGEKKRMEILQLALLKPSIAILDETDSGLDIDALKAVAEGISKARTPSTGTLIITHYKRILDYLPPDKIIIMINGRVVKEDGPELIDRLEQEGYQWMKE